MEAGEKGNRCESDAMLSLCTGAAFMISLGNREEESSDERSQETCLFVEFRICSPQIGFLSLIVFSIISLAAVLVGFSGEL